MNLKEIKKLINLSGGKLILSDGDLKESFIVMKINDYLLEKEYCDCMEDGELEEEFEEDDFDQIDFIEEDPISKADLTDSELLDKINTDIEELKKRKQEGELNNVIESEFLSNNKKEGEINYEEL